LNLPVNEVFAELEPVSWPVGPDRIWQSGTGSNQAVCWSYERGQQPLTSRVYADDRLVAETTDRMIRATELPPGLHRVFVSAVYDSGESRWIGPEMVFVPGKLLVMQDPALYHLFQKELGRGLPETQLLEIFEGDLSRIENIEIVQPVASLGDLVFCSRLKRLVINGYSGISLDAESLAGLTQLRILEWRNGTVSHPESLGRVNFLTELRLIGTSVPTLGFLRNLGNLLTLEYSGNAVPDADVIGALPRLEELRLSNASIKDPSFLAGMYNLVSLDLSSNDIEETGFLAKLSNLRFANLSDNRISNLLLTERLQALERVNASGNRIEGITATAELRRLRHLDLSSNRMVTPGRLFIYTPALEDLNLSGNNLRDMGLQRCPNLRLINVSDNNLLTTEWFSLQPELKRIVLTRNRISDLSGMMMNDLYKNLEYIDLIGNPLSKQSFAEHIPLLVTFADTVLRPAGCQPLSPCYATPCSGTCAPGTDAILSWSAEDPGGNILYDVYTIQGDSLVPLSLGLDTARLELDRWPSRAFSWAVAARTPDTVFYSGIYRVVLSDLWNVPFREGFEAYPKGTSIAEQSGIWLTENERRGSEGKAVVSENGPKSGIHCLELDSGMTAILPAGHLRVPYFALRFSAKFTTGARGCFEVANMNGTCLRMEYDGTDSGKFYVNNRFHCFFRTEPGSWMDFDILGHARNNNFHVMADNQVLINDWWPVPEGFIRIGEVRFSTVGGSLLIDDVRVNAPAALGISETRADCSDGFVMGPNPFDDFFRISFSQGGRYEMRLRDSMGRLVFLHSVYASAGAVYTVSPVAISPGIYFFDSGIPGAQPVKLIKSQPGY
jgi:Leucine-rich repeat (LRR) protein